MWQLVDAAYKAYEICHFVGLKKKKSHCYSLRFLRNMLTKNSRSSVLILAKSRIQVQSPLGQWPEIGLQ